MHWLGLAPLGIASGWAQGLLTSPLPHWHEEVLNLSELCRALPTGAQAKPSPCKQPHAFGFASRGNMFFSVSRHKTVKPGQNHPINSTEHDKSGQRVTKELRQPRVPSQTQNS